MPGNPQAIDSIRLIKHYPEPHTSFLSATRKTTAEAFPDQLYAYLLELVKNPEECILPALLTPEQTAWMVYCRLMEEFGKGELKKNDEPF